MTGRLWALIQAHVDAQPYSVSQAQLARRLGVSTSLVSLWKQGATLPKPEQLRRVATVTGASYLTVLNAALTDAGYLQREELMEHDNAAPKTQAGSARTKQVPRGRRGFTRRPGIPETNAQVDGHDSTKDEPGI